MKKSLENNKVILESTFSISLFNSNSVISVSDNIYDLLGFTSDSFLDGIVSLKDLIHSDDDHISNSLFSIKNIPISGSFNLRLRHKESNIVCVKAIYRKMSSNKKDESILELKLQDSKSLWNKYSFDNYSIEFKSMMQNTNDYIYFKDRNHVFTGVSQSLVSLTELSQNWKDLLGKTDYDVFSEEYADIYYSLEKQVFNGINVAHEIQETLDNKGNKGWVDNRKYPILDDNKQIIGLFGIARDITASKISEDALKLSENRFRTIFEGAPVGVALIESLTGKITQVNNQFTKISRRSEMELVKLSWMDLTHPDDIDNDLIKYEELNAGNIDQYEVEKRYIDKDGNQGWIKKKVSKLIVDEDMKPMHLAMIEDITKNKKNEELLILSEKRFRTIFDESPLGVALIDSITGHIYEVNNKFAEIAGRSLSEMATINWMSITHPDDVQEDLDNMADLNSGKINGFKMEKRYIKPDGSYVWINMTISPLTVEDKDSPRHLCMIDDITEKKRVECELYNYKNKLEEKFDKRTVELKASQERLVHSEKLSTLGKFAGTVAHEFNNPLFGVINLVDQMGGKLEEEERKKFSDLAQSELWRMADMIKNLQSFYKPSEGIFTNNSMCHLLDDVLLISGKAARNKGIEFKKNYKSVEYSFEGIEDQIKQVLLNILQNSIDSISAEGEIVLNMAQNSKEIILEIQDTGSGIRAEDKKFIFDPFFSTKGKFGTGLGLSVSYGIIKKHGGEISIDSELNIGSTITLILPRKRKK
jgi:PAS domain S-box-containing protein